MPVVTQTQEGPKVVPFAMSTKKPVRGHVDSDQWDLNDALSLAALARHAPVDRVLKDLLCLCAACADQPDSCWQAFCDSTPRAIRGKGT